MIGTRTMDDYDGPDYDLEDARAEARWERQRHARLMRNPDCRDPDHPGCENCAEDDESAEGAESAEGEGDDEAE